MADQPAALTETSATLTWSESPGALRYSVYFGDAPEPPLFAETTTPKLELTTLEPCRTYYWRVEVTSAIGTASSAVKSFQSPCGAGWPSEPTNPTPAHNAVDQPLNVSLSWLPVANAESYEVYFGSTPTPPFLRITTEPRLVDLPPLKVDGVYRWRVVARNATGSTTSRVWNFSTVETASAPSPPGNLSPRNGISQMPTRLRLRWREVPDARGYQVFLGSSPDSMRLQAELNTQEYVIREPLELNTQYYWQVAAVGERANSQGQVWTFQTAPTPLPPATPTDLAPSTGAIGVPPEAALTWAEVPDADSYVLLLGNSSAPMPVATVTQPRFQPEQNLEIGKSYFWRVLARNSVGNSSTPVQSFAVRVPPPERGRDWQSLTSECRAELTDLSAVMENSFDWRSSPNGQFIGFSQVDTEGDGRSDLTLYDVQAARVRRLGVRGAFVHISDDGRYIYYVTDSAINDDDRNGAADIGELDRETGERAWISSGLTGRHQPASVSHDRKHALFALMEDKDCSIDLFLLDRDTGTIEQVSLDQQDRAVFALWGVWPMSSDAKYVAMPARLNDGQGIVHVLMRDTVNGTTTDLTPNETYAIPLDMSANGRYLVAYAHAETCSRYFVIDAQTNERIEITESDNCTYGNAAISGDGQYVAYASLVTANGVDGTEETFYSIFLRDLGSGETRLLTQRNGRPVPAELIKFTGNTCLVNMLNEQGVYACTLIRCGD